MDKKKRRKKQKRKSIQKLIAAILALAAASALFNILNDNNINLSLFNCGTISQEQKESVHSKEEEKKENVTLTGEMLPYVSAGDVGDERICMYSIDEYEPLYNFQLANENTISINIENIFIKVLDYKDFSEFIVKRPAGGASMHDIIYWQCNISPKTAQYSSILIGTDKNNTEDLSESKYVSIKEGETGRFLLKILPDTPGLYEAKIIIEYTSYEGQTKKIELENIKFIYDPNHEANIDPSW